MPLPTIVDSHCHLDVQAFAEDLDAVLARARDAGIQRMLTICQRFGDLPRVVEISERYDEVFHAIGIHPHLVGTEAPATVGHTSSERPDSRKATSRKNSSAPK